MALEVTCTRHMHRSHHEVLRDKVLACASAVLSSSLKPVISPLVILEVLIMPQLRPTPAPVETPTVSAKPLIVHTVLKAVETCTAQHVARCSMKWLTFATYNRSFAFFFFLTHQYRKRQARKINPAAGSGVKNDRLLLSNGNAHSSL